MPILVIELSTFHPDDLISSPPSMLHTGSVMPVFRQYSVLSYGSPVVPLFVWLEELE